VVVDNNKPPVSCPNRCHCREYAEHRYVEYKSDEGTYFEVVVCVPIVLVPFDLVVSF